MAATLVQSGVRCLVPARSGGARVDAVGLSQPHGAGDGDGGWWGGGGGEGEGGWAEGTLLLGRTDAAAPPAVSAVAPRAVPTRHLPGPITVHGSNLAHGAALGCRLASPSGTRPSMCLPRSRDPPPPAAAHRS